MKTPLHHPALAQIGLARRGIMRTGKATVRDLLSGRAVHVYQASTASVMRSLYIPLWAATIAVITAWLGSIGVVQVIAGVIVLAWWLYTRDWFERFFTRPAGAPPMAEYAHAEHRVRCTGKARQIDRVLAVAPIDGEHFEPYMMRVNDPFRWHSLLTFLALCYFLYRAAPSILRAPTAALDLIAPTFIVLGLVTMFTHIVLLRTDIRVVPGRMDILTAHTFRAPTSRSIDLRLSSILIDLDDAFILLKDPQLEDFTYMRLHRVRDVRALASAILRAAVCPHPAPPLPKHELLG